MVPCLDSLKALLCISARQEALLLCVPCMMLAESEEKGNLRRDMTGARPHSGLGETDDRRNNRDLDSLNPACLPSVYSLVAVLKDCRRGDKVSNTQAWHELVWDGSTELWASSDEQDLSIRRFCLLGRMQRNAMQCNAASQSLAPTRRRQLNQSNDNTLPRWWEELVPQTRAPVPHQSPSPSPSLQKKSLSLQRDGRWTLPHLARHAFPGAD